MKNIIRGNFIDIDSSASIIFAGERLVATIRKHIYPDFNKTQD
ncbi:MAG: hypothetical protein AB1488_04410 [Nitrospirota bacterium]